MRHTMLRVVTSALLFTAMTVIPAKSQALGKYKFCAKWAYQFTDQGLGEDYLVHISGYSYGRIAAARNWANVLRNGTDVWNGYMDTNGCTGAVTASAGTYTFQVIPAVATSNKNLWVYPDHNQSWLLWNISQSLPAYNDNTATIDYNYDLCCHPVAQAAAVATHIINRSVSDSNILPDRSSPYLIWATEPDCEGYSNGVPGVAILCADKSGQWDANKKFVVGHEMGHVVQSALYGNPSHNYSQNSTAPLCRCDHVVSSNKEHCIQSRHDISTVQLEGWAQFYSTELLNNPSHTNATIGYYKEFLASGYNCLNGDCYYPPVAIDAYADRKWMNSKCSTTDHFGVEMDWMQFYWWIKNSGTYKYSYSQIKDVYYKACGNSDCAYDVVLWDSLKAAANTLYGAGSSKANFWINTGSKKGVNH